MVKSIALFGLLFYTGCGWAAAVQDFAWRAPLSQSDEEIQRVELPIDVLLDSTNADLGDIAVFDKNGDRLPGWVRQQQPVATQHDIALTFHRLSDYESEQPLSVSKREATLDNGRMTEYQMRGNVPVKLRKLIYMIELSDTQQKLGISAIELKWIHQPVNQLLHLRVEVGNNLENWRVVHHRKSLFKGGREKQSGSRIAGIPAGYRYIRLIPSKAVDTFTLQSVAGFYATQSHIEDLVYSTGKLKQDVDHPAYYYFTQPTALSAKSFELIPARQGFVKGNLYASRSDFRKKRLIKKNLSQFNIAPSALTVGNKPVQLHRAQEKYWWFKPDTPLDTEVTVKWFYPRYEYLFLANGQSPYTLGWGNHTAGIPANDLKQLLKKEKQQASYALPFVQLGQREKSGGASRLLPEKKLPWMKWVLWLALIGGVLAMARMAWRLYREMSQ